MAESFGTDAERYDRARPRYPEPMVERLVATAPGTRVLDVGCGTGIAARQFQSAGCAVFGVEPDERMAQVARDLGLEVDVARFEDWDPAGRRFDAVVAATAWHWIDPVAGAAKAGAVLPAGGVLATFWNAFVLPAEVAEATAAAYQRVVPDSPLDLRAMAAKGLDGYDPALDRTAEGIAAAGGFADTERWRFGWEWTYSREAWLDQLPTTGGMAVLSPEQVAEVLKDVGAAIDGLGGSFTMSYRTVVAVAVRA
ncbi:MAG: class I SAM-dependent methyltransferase [Nonomuraea sp.]|nr:class I SAM-dependent methyltransferase [Nonomuraea sp.]